MVKLAPVKVKTMFVNRKGGGEGGRNERHLYLRGNGLEGKATAAATLFSEK